jgi:hypothetical protein
MLPRSDDAASCDPAARSQAQSAGAGRREGAAMLRVVRPAPAGNQGEAANGNALG